MLPLTEQYNAQTQDIDCLDTSVLLERINQQDQQVALAVQQAIGQITPVVNCIVNAFNTDGRLFYVGAGTSGRLGVLDASECVPTFGVPASLVQGIIAGGSAALTTAVEGAEDDAAAGQAAIVAAGVTANDVVVGLSASGKAKFVEAALAESKVIGAVTAAISCSPDSVLLAQAHYPILVQVGPEVITGSTRLKAGTAQKLVLNMLTTASMVQWGKTWGNLMVDVQPTNQKLKQRAVRLVKAFTHQADDAMVEGWLNEAQWQVKLAIVMGCLSLTRQQAEQQLAQAQGKLKVVLPHVQPRWDWLK